MTDSIKLDYSLRNKEEIFNIPYSKSISNRVLLINYLSKNKLQLERLSQSDDTTLLKSIINSIETKQTSSFNTCNAGTTTRFLIALLSIIQGQWVVNADERMNDRPILPLVNSLQQLGADISINSEQKIFPITIKGTTLKGGKTIKVASSQSSQIVSALSLIAPYCEGGLNIEYPKGQTSLSYIDMTLSIMQNCKIAIKREDNLICIREGEYKFNKEIFEADWSSASFAYALVAISKEIKLFIPGLKEDSLQGDKVAKDIFLNIFGVVTTFTQEGAYIEYSNKVEKQFKEVNFSSCPDLFLPVFVSYICTESQMIFSGLQTLSLKESDRLNNAIQQIKKLNAKVNLENFVLRIDKSKLCFDNSLKFIPTYNDHRMAMAFSLLAIKDKGIVIENPNCVSKSFPMYWEELSKFFSY